MTGRSSGTEASAAPEMQCRICGSGALQELPAFAELRRVTSDCKPWPAGGRLAVCAHCGGIQKIADRRWLAEIDEIYGAYQIYHLSDGAEQVIFASDQGTASPRSRTLVDHVVATAGLPERGRLIDIGCGNGAALATFSAALPGWSLYGSELSDSALPALRRLANFVELYQAEPAEIPGRFELVSMIHALEHMPDPMPTLRDAAALVADGGSLFVEVPDTGAWPFDLLVADHLAHFTPASLRYLAARAGLSTLALSNRVLTKEISFLGRPDAAAEAPLPDAAQGQRTVARALRWLEAVREQARSLAATRPFGIFGTSISGMWLYGELREAVDFFVDEDRSRVGRSYEGRPILAPAEAPAGSTVYIPLIPVVADNVAKRLAGLPATFVPTPSYDDLGAAA